MNYQQTMLYERCCSLLRLYFSNETKIANCAQDWVLTGNTVPHGVADHYEKFFA